MSSDLVAAALAAVRGQHYAEVEHKYRKVQKPVLLMWGREDVVTPVTYGERLVRDLPNARLSVYPRCGHFPMLEAKEESTRELIAFLDEVDAAPAPANGTSGAGSATPAGSASGGGAPSSPKVPE